MAFLYRKTCNLDEDFNFIFTESQGRECGCQGSCRVWNGRSSTFLCQKRTFKTTLRASAQAFLHMPQVCASMRCCCAWSSQAAVQWVSRHEHPMNILNITQMLHPAGGACIWREASYFHPPFSFLTFLFCVRKVFCSFVQYDFSYSAMFSWQGRSCCKRAVVCRHFLNNSVALELFPIM